MVFAAISLVVGMLRRWKDDSAMKILGFAVTAAAVVMTVLTPLAAQAQSAASDWMRGNSSRVRLIAARVKTGKLLAGVQVELDEGWKTYWRNPGEAGGVPPELDWKASGNLAENVVMFPAPIRLRDANGDNIGYKHGVTLPVRITAADPAKPVTLDLKILFGVCKNICIPEDRHLTLTLDSGGATDAAIIALLDTAIARVPVAAAENSAATQIEALTLDAAKHVLLIDTRVAGPAESADLFIESPDGLYVPMTEKRSGGPEGLVRFAVDLTKSDDMKTPSGKSLRFTLVGEAGASETVRAVP